MPETEKIMETSPAPLIEAMDTHVPPHPESPAAADPTRVLDSAFAAELATALNEAAIPTLETPAVQPPNTAVRNGGRNPRSNTDRTLRGAIWTLATAVGASLLALGVVSLDREPTESPAPLHATTSTTSSQPTTTAVTTTLRQPSPLIAEAPIAPATSTTVAPTTTTAPANRMPINIDVQAVIADALESLQATTTTAAQRPTTTAATSTTSVPPVTTTRPSSTVTTQQSVPNSSFTPAR